MESSTAFPAAGGWPRTQPHVSAMVRPNSAATSEMMLRTEVRTRANTTLGPPLQLPMGHESARRRGRRIATEVSALLAGSRVIDLFLNCSPAEGTKPAP